jgi:hypothetical protein
MVEGVKTVLVQDRFIGRLYAHTANISTSSKWDKVEVNSEGMSHVSCMSMSATVLLISLLLQA